MTLIIINDASCLIDLLKGRLLHAMLALPFEFVIPHPVRHSELLTLSAQDWQMMDERGVEIYDLEPDAVREAFEIKATHPRLSANDCFCLVASLRRENAILLTGDLVNDAREGEYVALAEALTDPPDRRLRRRGHPERLQGDRVHR